ncbi:MAG: hypothetical protein ACI9SY_000763 [Candidatus Paceibacteria bacterium]
MAVTFSPRACRQVAIDDEATPFPTPLMTPPTMKMYLGVFGVFGVFLETLLVADLVAVFFGIFFAVAIKDIV